MDKTQKDAVKKYAKLAGLPRDKSLSSGRKDVDKGKDAHIWRDIESKLGFYENCEVLDLGCGFGGLIDYCIESSKKQSWKLTLFDIPEVIEALFQNQTEHDMFGINTYSGIYPYEVDDKLLEKMFDRILLYSVLHYTDNPKELLLKLAGQLRSGGRMLVGDLPNVNKKGRFLSSNYGKQFEAKYQNVKEEELPVYVDQFDYVDKVLNQNKEINDNLIVWAMQEFRHQGYNVFVIPQPEELPYSLTREDVLICKP